MKKYYPTIIFAFLTLAIMTPLYSKGFIFLLDMVWAPNIQLSDYLDNGLSAGFPLILLFKLLSFILPVFIIQKIVLSSILFFSGFFMHKLAGNFMARNWAVLSGVFYMINPYVYERFLAGHWLVLAGYAFFPLVILKFWQMLRNPNRRNFYVFAVLFALYPIISLHWAYIACFLLIPLAIAHLAREKKLSLLFSAGFLKQLMLFALIFLAVNSFWLFGFFSSESIMHKITLNDFNAFAAQDDPYWGVYFNILSLYGYWQNFYWLPKDIFSYWWILTFFILILSAIGAYRLVKKKNILAIALIAVFIPVVLIAVGYGSSLTKPMINFLYYTLPGFKGLRETAKLAGLLAFTYALLMPVGAKYLAEYISNNMAFRKRQAILFMSFLSVLVIPVLAVNGMFLGFNGQVKAYHYPDGWHRVEQELRSDAETKKALFLPWHGYPILSFAGNHRAANPARVFFSVDIIAGKNIDNVYLLETEQGIWDKKISSLLHGMETLDENIDFFKSRNVSHIILAKIHDWDRYDFLDKSTRIKKVFENDEAVLYKISN